MGDSIDNLPWSFILRPIFLFFSYFFVLMGTRRPFKSQDNKCIYVQNIIYDSSVDSAELNVLVEKKNIHK